MKKKSMSIITTMMKTMTSTSITIMMKTMTNMSITITITRIMNMVIITIITTIMTMTTKGAKSRNMVLEPSYIIAARHSTWVSSMSLLQENGLVTSFVPRVSAILLMNRICAMFSSRLVSRRLSSRQVSGSQQCQPTSSQNCARTIRSLKRNGMRNLVTV